MIYNLFTLIYKLIDQNALPIVPLNVKIVPLTLDK